MKLLNCLSFVIALGMLQLSSFAQNIDAEEFRAVVNIDGETREFDNIEDFERAMENMDPNGNIKLNIKEGGEKEVDIHINVDGFNFEDESLDEVDIEEVLRSVQQHIDIEIDDDNGVRIFKFDSEDMEDQMNKMFEMERDGEKMIFKQYCNKSENKAFLGVFPDYCCNCTDEGVKIKRVVPESAAEKAGLLAEDVIISIDGNNLSRENSLHHSLAGFEVGDVISVVYKRGDVVNTVDVTLGDKPTSQLFESRCEDFINNRHKHQSFDYSRFSESMEDKPFLGVYLRNSEEPGVYVTGIVEGSAAEAAGLKSDDRIVSIDGVATTNPGELSEIIGEHEIGDIIEVRFIRNGNQETQTVVLGKKERSSAFYGGCGKPLGMIEKETEKAKEQKILFRDKDGNLQELEMDEDVEVIIIDGENGNVSIDRIIDEETGTKVVKLKVLVDDADEADKQILRSIDTKSGALELPTKERLAVNNFDFFPNPNNGKFTIDFDLPEQGSMVLRIVDLAGKEVYRDVQPDFKGQYKNTIDISESPAGTYLVQVQQNGRELTKKVIIR